MMGGMNFGGGMPFGTNMGMPGFGGMGPMTQ
jgi:hypothetical protein